MLWAVMGSSKCLTSKRISKSAKGVDDHLFAGLPDGTL